MLFKQVIFAASASAAVLTPSHGAVTRSAKPGVVYNTLNLDDFDPAMNNGALDKRVDWKWCAQSGQNIATCVNTGAALINTIVAIANGIKAKSNAHDCSYSSGTTGDAQYQIHATGSNCDTTAEEGTIEGGLKTYFDAHGGAVCDVHCVQQTHGGTYTGYLLIAPQGTDISGVVCDASVQFPNDCGEGGKNNAP